MKGRVICKGVKAEKSIYKVKEKTLVRGDVAQGCQRLS